MAEEVGTLEVVGKLDVNSINMSLNSLKSSMSSAGGKVTGFLGEMNNLLKTITAIKIFEFGKDLFSSMVKLASIGPQTSLAFAKLEVLSTRWGKALDRAVGPILLDIVTWLEKIDPNTISEWIKNAYQGFKDWVVGVDWGELYTNLINIKDTIFGIGGGISDVIDNMKLLSENPLIKIIFSKEGYDEWLSGLRGGRQSEYTGNKSLTDELFNPTPRTRDVGGEANIIKTILDIIFMKPIKVELANTTRGYEQ